MSDLARSGAPSSTPAPATSPTAATLVRVLASVVDLVVTDHDPVGHEPAVRQAVEASAEALSGLVGPDPERTAEALDVLVGVVDALPAGDPTLSDRWRAQVRMLTPALATARLVVSRMEAMVDEFTRLAGPPAPAAPAHASPGHAAPAAGAGSHGGSVRAVPASAPACGRAASEAGPSPARRRAPAGTAGPGPAEAPGPPATAGPSAAPEPTRPADPGGSAAPGAPGPAAPEP